MFITVGVRGQEPCLITSTMRKQRRMTAVLAVSFPPPVYVIHDPYQGMESPTVEMGLLTSVNQVKTVSSDVLRGQPKLHNLLRGGDLEAYLPVRLTIITYHHHTPSFLINPGKQRLSYTWKGRRLSPKTNFGNGRLVAPKVCDIWLGHQVGTLPASTGGSNRRPIFPRETPHS